MLRLSTKLAICCAALAALITWGEPGAAEPKGPVRGILLKRERATPELLAAWKSKGVTAVVVPLDETTRPRWSELSKAVEQAGLTLWPWVEVARNPAMAAAHPEWMASPGGHHDDWRRRFPSAPKANPRAVIKTWPWVPIGYAPALEAHRERLEALLGDLPGLWAGVFLNDLQAGPSSCGCGNDQCRWALDYGSPATAPKTPGDDAAARIVAELIRRHPGKTIVPVWVTECEPVDLPDAPGGTGLCGRVRCAKGDCWPRYTRAWNPLLRATEGPIALALWPETFHRDPSRWVETDLALFQNPPGDSAPLPAARTVAIVQAWKKPEADVVALFKRAQGWAQGWVLALDPIDQSWEPRVFPPTP
jgi:hypothetical protein